VSIQPLVAVGDRVVCRSEVNRNRLVCWSIVVKEKQTVGSPFFRVFPSDRVPKATKDINVHFFIHSSNYYKLY